jgi:hypothetical protein
VDGDPPAAPPQLPSVILDPLNPKRTTTLIHMHEKLGNLRNEFFAVPSHPVR